MQTGVANERTMFVDDQDHLTHMLGYPITAIAIHDQQITVRLKATTIVKLICTNALLLNPFGDCVALLRLSDGERCVVVARAIMLSQHTLLCYLVLANDAYLAILAEDIYLTDAQECDTTLLIQPECPHVGGRGDNRIFASFYTRARQWRRWCWLRWPLFLGSLMFLVIVIVLGIYVLDKGFALLRDAGGNP
jgi:hypothetical protein